MNDLSPLSCGRWTMLPKLCPSPSRLSPPLTLHASSLASTEVRDDPRLALLLSLELRDNALLNPRQGLPGSRSFDLVGETGV